MATELTGISTIKPRQASFGAAPTKKSEAPVSSPAMTTAKPCSYETVKAYQSGISSSLSTEVVQKKYAEVSSMLDPETRTALSGLLKSGVLLNNESDDGSTVLDNLHRIATEPRIRGLNPKTLLKETITSISDPGTITQNFGDIPKPVADAIFRHPERGIRTTNELYVPNSATCVAASIQYSLAQKLPAEYARMAAGFSSESMSVDKTIDYSALADSKDDASWLLDKFGMSSQPAGENALTVKVSPDRNAIIRARVQTSFRDPGERSSLDVLMQSAFMNIGSQQTYNALNDTRKPGAFNPDNGGLTDFEKTFVEGIVTGSGKKSVQYQALDETGKIIGYTCDFAMMRDQLLSALQSGQNIIAGIVDTDSDNRIINGHEITVTNAALAPNGELLFVCNDTADNDDEPIVISESQLLPKIHHAGLPKDTQLAEGQITSLDYIEYFKQNV